MRYARCLRVLLLKFIHKRLSLFNDTIGFHESEYSETPEIEEMREKHDFMLDVDIHSKEGKVYNEICHQ